MYRAADNSELVQITAVGATRAGPGAGKHTGDFSDPGSSG